MPKRKNALTSAEVFCPEPLVSRTTLAGSRSCPFQENLYGRKKLIPRSVTTLMVRESGCVIFM